LFFAFHVHERSADYLKALTQLQYLHLDNTQVTDAGLEPIDGKNMPYAATPR